MGTATCLCRDAVVEVVKRVHNIDPSKEQQWQDHIVRPALALIESFELLSKGWSNGLLGIMAALIASAMGNLLLVINIEFCEAYDSVNPNAFFGIGKRNVGFLGAIFYIIFAMLIARDAASSSSQCCELSKYLTKRDVEHELKYHRKIEALRVALGRQVRRTFISSFI